jgi:hypothetical protein
VKKNIKEAVLPIVERGVIPVIAGISGKTKDGKNNNTWQGRKWTQLLSCVQNLIGADQVILVTDADGHNVW